MIAFYEDRKDRFCAKNHTDDAKQLACSAHLHFHIEVAMLLEGNTVAFADTEEYHMQAGDIFISFPNQVHHFNSKGEERFFLMIIHPDLIPDLAPLFTHKRPQSALISGVANDEEIRHLADRICGFYRDELTGLQEIECQGYLLSFFAKLLSYMTLKEAPANHTGTLNSIISYCLKNYQNDLSLTTLEKDLHISKYYISHLFSDKLCIGFNDYINSLRVSFACNHLRRSDLSITEIASVVGFASPRTFNRAFLKQIGVTPSAYRQAKKPKK